MMRRSILAALAMATAFAAVPAQACARHEPLNLRSALSADLVVTGRIGNYRAGPGGNEFFDVAVDQVLRGRAGRRLTVRYSGRMLGPPQSLPRRPVLIALQRDGGTYAVLWHICSDPFMLPAGSAQAAATRRLLAQRQPARR
jgi:hypothetical protein